jgi:hypothetical protein
MMGSGKYILTAVPALFLLFSACTRSEDPVREIMAYPLDDLNGVITRSGVELDNSISADGGGSLKIIAAEPITVRLFETGDVDVEDARLIYSAMVRTEDVSGQVYLEMWCGFPGGGRYFSRGLDRPVTGTVEWKSLDTPFFLKKGQNPDQVWLNIVVNGTGTVWIDDVKLAAGPL